MMINYVPQAYKEMMRCSSCVQPLSCDEAFIDVTALGDPASLAEKLRASIFEVTSCTVSVGIGPNLLLARLATKKAKPNGQYRIAAADVGTILAGLELRDLPGVGWATAQRLEEMGITTVPELQACWYCCLIVCECSEHYFMSNQTSSRTHRIGQRNGCRVPWGKGQPYLCGRLHGASIIVKW